jgi:phospholipid N-methyltransferase
MYSHRRPRSITYPSSVITASTMSQNIQLSDGKAIPAIAFGNGTGGLK